ncbi:unnamed protein product [Trichobilharzia szidati]|nr:unnamed protein product [Trichobilharzia szidati]
MDPEVILAIICTPFVVALCITLFFRFRHKFLVACLLTGILLSLCSAFICLTICRGLISMCVLACSLFIGFSVLEDILKIAFIFLTRRLKVKVLISLWGLSLASLIVAIILIFVNCDKNVCNKNLGESFKNAELLNICTVISGGFFNTAVSLIAVIFADMLK